MRERRLTIPVKFVFSLGDQTVNLVLNAMTLLYFRYLTDEIHFSGLLAGLVPWIGRIVDAFTDPAMGRISDRTRWRWGRRRPYLLMGCVPFGVSFALLWVDVPFASDLSRFAYYAAVYLIMSVAMSVCSVPYLALIPEMSRDYDERTSLNTWRAALAITGVFGAVGMSLLALRLGDDVRAWNLAAGIVAVWLILPWFAVHAVTWERPVDHSAPAMRLAEGLRVLWRHDTYRILSATFITGRIAIDVVSTMLIYYVSWVLGRRGDFEYVMIVFVGVVLVAMPFWLRLSRRLDKRSVFIAGVLWWAVAQAVIGFGGPEWPRWVVFAVAAFAGVGYAVADFMPWAMLPDVIDEDEVRTGERREGLYTGMFTFLRKIGGATAVLVIGGVLDLSGYDGSLEAQPGEALLAIRVLVALVPVALLLLSAWLARRYPLSREAHRALLAQLEARPAAR